ncbi:MAG: AAA family ATPase [Verrucomicrobiales bacterium]
MRLISITLRNYRVHREVKIELDPARTLIGGPNECGKSTLVEAAHRALFLRAKTGGEAQKSMTSRIYGGQPEVEVCFEARGRAYRLLKRFSGANGTATLTEVDGSTWNGDEAEARLAELLGVEAPGGGRGAGNRAKEQWAHLWIWQGCAGDDPTEHANAQCAPLLARLQHEGGAAAMQSECDAHVARQLSERHDSLFNRNGDPKAGSELARAIAEENAALAARAAAEQTLARLEQAVIDFREAEQTIQTADAALVQLRQNQEAVETSLDRVAALRAEEQTQAPAAANAAEKHEALVQADGRLRQLRADIEKSKAALAPKEAETQRLCDEETERRKRDAAADEACQQVVSQVRAARLRHELAASHIQGIEKATQRDQISKKLEQVRELRASVSELEGRLAQTPAITAQMLKALQKAEGECSSAASALDAMAAGIEVLASDAPVFVGDRALVAGESHILTDDAEVVIGPAIRLRVRPGGGTSLAETRQRLQKARTTLQQKLDTHGLASVIEAAQACTRRQQLESAIETTKARLEGLGAETIDHDYIEAVNACTAAETDVERRAVLVADFSAPTTLIDAKSLVRQSSEQLRDVEANETNVRAARDAAAKALQRAGARLAEHRKGLEGDNRAVTDLEAQVRLSVETYGEDSARMQRLAEILAARTEAERLLGATRHSLGELQPDLLERDRSRYQRAIEQHTLARNEAEQKRAVARSELHRDGTSDPHADLALAEAQRRSASEHRVIAERKAGAIRLLHELFLAEQKALAGQFTRPLAVKISSYLECLFGPGARAVVDLENNAFTGLRLIRPAQGPGAFDFESLSGGTCEQVAAAVRLAMAEVLAPAHDGCLPLVFDDAFAYSDPERVQILQRMLDNAANRGLQVIVLTCDPTDYAALGARQITFSIERTPTRDRTEEDPLE